MLWFEARLASSQGGAYSTNQSNSFTLAEFDDIPSSYYAYQGRFRGLVQDDSISTPNSGIFINGNFVSGDSTGVIIDYKNGRVVVPQASGVSLNITANNSVKEVQVYPYEDDEAQLVLSSDFVDFDDQSSTFLSSLVGDVAQNTYILPACFLRHALTENENYAFGGEKDSRTKIRAVVIAKDNYIIDGLMSLFADTQGSCVTIFPYEDHPYGVLDSIKSFPYSYTSFQSQYGRKSYIEKVHTSKLDYGISMNKLEKNILIGFIDFDLSTFRVPT